MTQKKLLQWGLSVTMVVLLIATQTLEAQPPFPSLPPNPVNLVVVLASTTYLSATLSNVPNGYEVTNATYGGWCGREHIYITAGKTYAVTLRSSYDPSLSSYWMWDPDWDKVNYIINHKSGHTVMDIQRAIWHFLDTAYGGSDPEVLALIAVANAHGEGFVPSVGELILVINDAGPSVQLTFFELRVDRPVPIELSSFHASAKAEGVLVSWSTQSEIENLGFHIFRSTEREGEYARINATLIPGAGNSNDAHDYSYIDREVETGQTYYYKLADVDFNGTTRFSGPVSVAVTEMPKQYALEQNYPNPFTVYNPNTSIGYHLKSNGAVKIAIYNAVGQLVRTVVEANQETGSYMALWNGRDQQGQRVASGVYLYRLEVNGFTETRKLLVSK